MKLQELKDEGRKQFENYESSLARAGVNSDNINYDVLAEERNIRWKEIDSLITKAYEEGREKGMRQLLNATQLSLGI